MAVTRNEADFIGSVIQAWLYGFYCVAFYLYIKTTSNRPNLKREPSHVHFLLIALFVLSTSASVLDLTQQFMVVVRGRVDKPIGVINATASYLLISLEFISQIILITRCYMVWNRNKLLAIIPGFFSLAAFGAGVAVCVQSSLQLARFAKSPEWIYGVGCFSFVTSMFVNLLISIIMSAKIYSVDRTQEESGSPFNFRLAATYVLEGQGLILIVQILMAVFFTTNHPAWNIAAGPALAAYGLNSTTVILRVYLNKTYEQKVEARTKYAPELQKKQSVESAGSMAKEEA